MDEHRVLGVARLRAQRVRRLAVPRRPQAVEGYEDELGRELSGYLLEHARRERISLATRPAIEFRTDERLRLGEFGIQARLVRPPRTSRSTRARATMAGRSSTRCPSGWPSRCAIPTTAAAPRGCASGGRTDLLGPGGAVLGRWRDADIVVDDPNVSRRHAEVRPSGGSWIVRDLGSTNGVKVNGRRSRVRSRSSPAT